jgi:hypothetical protein
LILLSSPAPSAVTVTYTIGGTATAGVDYGALTGSVVIGAGSDSATIIVTPVDDAEIEGEEEITITLQAGSGYGLESPSSNYTILFDDEYALRATTPLAAPAASVDPVSEKDVRPLALAAAVYWARAGIEPSTLTTLRDVTFVTADLPGSTLAMVSGTTVFVDANAAGYGWFVDPTPGSDEEFGGAGIGNRMDLLTAVMHEMGHILGLDDLDHDDHDLDLMTDSLAAGRRRTLSHDDIDSVFAEDDWNL